MSSPSFVHIDSWRRENVVNSCSPVRGTLRKESYSCGVRPHGSHGRTRGFRTLSHARSNFDTPNFRIARVPGSRTRNNGQCVPADKVSTHPTLKHLRGLTVLPSQVQRLPVTSLPPSAEPSHRHLAVTISPTCCVTRKTGIIASWGYLRQH